MISHYRSFVDRWMGGLHGDWETDYRDTTQLFSLFKLKSVNGCRPNDVHPGRQAVSERFYWLCDTPNERSVVMNQLAVKSNNCWWPFVHWKAADGLDGRILMQWRGQLLLFIILAIISAIEHKYLSTSTHDLIVLLIMLLNRHDSWIIVLTLVFYSLLAEHTSSWMAEQQQNVALCQLAWHTCRNLAHLLPKRRTRSLLGNRVRRSRLPE